MNHHETSRRNRCRAMFRPLLELLEARIVFASDFGDAPLPYKTLVAEGGAEHVAIGPMLGSSRDTEADGVHSAAADGDDIAGIDDEDGVTFGTIRAGALGATATVTVSGGSAKLDAWIDFNGDGSWGGPGEHIADAVAVATGNNAISFDVPSTSRDGTTYARFRLSTAGDLGVGGAAADGEVEDYAVTVTPPVSACGCFSGPIDVNYVAEDAHSVHAADVDSDGDTDVLSASVEDDKIAWYENDGSAHFTQHVISTTANGARSVVAADFDGDGDTDVLSASSYDKKIAWYENDGNQNFTEHIISTAANHAVSVYAADVDSDGDMDALSASVSGNEIAWYENDGNQNFTKHIISTSIFGANTVVAADVDGDGDIDVLSSSHVNDKIEWHENDGNENFTTHMITAAADFAASVFAEDMDNDGDLDVLSASRNDDEIAWYENDGNQSFTAHTITTTADSASSVFAVDLDDDGDMDALSTSSADDEVAWYENDGSQNFTTHVITNLANGAWSVFAADVNGDGDIDVLSASRTDHTIAWYENDGNQNFTFHIVAITVERAESVYAADVDGDGDTDILSASSIDRKIAWYENVGNEVFAAHTITTFAQGAHSVFAADVDGDSDMDVLSASLADDKIAWYENDGAQNFTPHTISSADGAYSVYTADVDGDGDTDVLSASDGDNTIAWYENDGKQSFVAHTISSNTFGARDVFAADVDGDGDTDVLSASAYQEINFSEKRIAWYENDGSQNFTPHTIAYTTAFAIAVFATDMDDDGDTDVLGAPPTGGGIAWYENDGSQNFNPHTISVSNEARNVIGADVDGDGDMDVVSASHFSDTVAWYENDGNQNFTTHNISTTTNGARSMYPADLDGDGDLDVVAGSFYDLNLTWFENLSFHVTNTNDAGPGSFRQAILEANAHSGVDTITFAIGSGPQTIAPTSALPTVTDTVIIDGTTQSGYAGTPIIEVWGLAAGPNVHGLTLAADNSVIKGLVVNLFSGNGILITGSGNTIENSYIGTDISGTVAVPNALNGIEITGGFNNTIGGTAAGTANIIAFNDGHGVLVDAGTNNAIQRNSIHSNDGLGIDLINAGNNNQRAPSVNSAVSGSGATSIAASLALVVPSTTYTIDFFSSAVCDPSGFGEGETYLGTKTLTTTATGRGRTMFVVGFEVPVGHVITATATSPFNDTSEFSLCRVVTAALAPGGNVPNPPPLRPSSETRFLQETGFLAAATPSPLPNGRGSETSDAWTVNRSVPLRRITRIANSATADAVSAVDVYFSEFTPEERTALSLVWRGIR